MNQDAIFVTGATGFIGSHFLISNHKNRSKPVYALVRGQTQEKRQKRLEKVLQESLSGYRSLIGATEIMQHLKLVDGDITFSHCGLIPEAISEMRAANVKEFWHFASSLSYEDFKKDEIEAHNVRGLVNALKLAKFMRAKRFIYVSTAFTCGLQRGAISEVIHNSANFEFGNYYEESKNTAERKVSIFCEASGMEYTILRPSIVIGPAETKRPAGSDSGLYGFIREIKRLSRILKNTNETVRLKGVTESTLNFIPIDFLLHDIESVIRHDFRGSKIIHLTSSQSVSVKCAVEMICQQCDIHNLKVVDDTKEDMSTIEALLERRTNFYKTYLNGNLTFDRSLSSRWSVNEDDYRSYVVEGIRSADKQSILESVRSQTLYASDNYPLTVYTAGDENKKTITIFNALGMPVEFWLPVINALKNEYRVITWETRGVPSLTENFEGTDCGIDRHISDAKDILNTFSISMTQIIGWSTGALTALKASVSLGLHIESVLLIGGGFHFERVQQSAFQKSLNEVMPKIAQNKKYAEFFYNAFFLRTNDAILQGKAVGEAQQQSSNIAGSTDPNLLHLTSIPFQSPENTYRYGRLITEHLKAKIDHWIDLVKMPVKLIVGSNDVTVPKEESVELKKHLIQAELVEIEGSDHFGIYKNAEVIKTIKSWLDEHAHKSLQAVS